MSKFDNIKIDDLGVEFLDIGKLMGSIDSKANKDDEDQ
jgi:hypothetical protein